MSLAAIKIPNNTLIDNRGTRREHLLSIGYYTLHFTLKRKVVTLTMRIYELANTELRGEVNLLDYKDIIEQVISEEAPTVKVTIEPDRYILDSDITKGQAIRIGRKIARSKLGKYCLLRSILFVGHSLPKSNKRSDKNNDTVNIRIPEKAKKNISSSKGGRPRFK